jgi:hypothetical protein
VTRCWSMAGGGVLRTPVSTPNGRAPSSTGVRLLRAEHPGQGDVPTETTGVAASTAQSRVPLGATQSVRCPVTPAM